MKSTSLLVFMLVILVIACNRTERTVPQKTITYSSNLTTGIVIADTIIYEVNIVNPNPEDTWTQECLRGLDHKALIDNIFNMVYEGNAIAFNHETGEKLTPAQVKNMEKEQDFSRDNIGMIQFKEAWYMNPGESDMTKKVISMVLGMGVYSNLGEFKGNKALMRIEMP